MKWFLLLLLLCRAGWAAAAPGDSLLRNGGFEELNAAGFPEGWYVFDEGAGSPDDYRQHNILFQADPNMVKTGRRSASMLHGAPEYLKWVMLRQDITEFKPGKHIIAGYVRWSGKSMARPCVALHLIDRNGGLEHPLVFYIGNQPTPDDWIYFYEEFEVGANVQTIGVNIIATDGMAHVYVDDVAIWRAEDAPPPPETRETAPVIVPAEPGHRATVQLAPGARTTLCEVDGEWYFKRPDGTIFWDLAMNHCSYPSADCWWDDMNPQRGAKVRARFPTMADWDTHAVNLLKQGGFTSLGAWSYVGIKATAAAAGLGYWQIFGFNQIGGEAYLLRNSHGTPIPVGGTSRMADPFDPDWQAAVDRHVAEVVAANGDLSSVMGYFPENEISLGVVPLYGYIAGKGASQAFADWLTSRYAGDIAALNRAWSTAEHPFDYADFAAIATALPGPETLAEGSRILADHEVFEDYMVEYYVDFVIRVIRRHDPDALIGSPRLPGENLAAYAPLRHFAKFDFIAVNAYPGKHYTNTQLDNFRKIHQITGRPLLITEWTVGATDRNHGGVAATQEERAVCYQNAVKQISNLPFLLGMHYQMWFSPDAIGGNQFGVVDQSEEPFEPFYDTIGAFQRRLNQR